MANLGYFDLYNLYITYHNISMYYHDSLHLVPIDDKKNQKFLQDQGVFCAHGPMAAPRCKGLVPMCMILDGSCIQLETTSHNIPLEISDFSDSQRFKHHLDNNHKDISLNPSWLSKTRHNISTAKNVRDCISEQNTSPAMAVLCLKGNILAIKHDSKLIHQTLFSFKPPGWKLGCPKQQCLLTEGYLCYPSIMAYLISNKPAICANLH